MNHYGTLRDFRFSEKDVDDIRGSNVYGLNDEKLGDINDVIFDHSTGDIRYVVVDTAGGCRARNSLCQRTDCGLLRSTMTITTWTSANSRLRAFRLTTKRVWVIATAGTTMKRVITRGGRPRAMCSTGRTRPTAISLPGRTR